MNKEYLSPKDTNCGYKIVCKEFKDCQILKGVDHQLIVSIDFEYNQGNRIIKWDLTKARNFLDRSIKMAGNCPKAKDIEIRGNFLIDKKFGTNS